jgi:hypothetical protein
MSSRPALSGVLRSLLPLEVEGFDSAAELAWVMPAGELNSHDWSAREAPL